MDPARAMVAVLDQQLSVGIACPQGALAGKHPWGRRRLRLCRHAQYSTLYYLWFGGRS
jgi:uncharacterized membrane-anchored protein